MKAKEIAASVIYIFLYMTSVMCFANSNSQQIVTAPNADEPKGAYYFDMGHSNSPVFKGFTQITVNSLYKPEVGYGWIHNNPGGRGEGQENLVNRVPKSMLNTKYKKPLPDDLTGDYIFWRGGNEPLIFRLNVTNGEYDIRIYTGMYDAGRFYDYASYQIKANGETKADVKITKESLLGGIFRECDDSYEWRPGHDMWAKYVKNQAAQVHSFTANVKEGKLDIEFHMPRNGGVVRGALLPINALIVCPAAEKSKMEAKIRRIDEERRGQFMEICRFRPFVETNTLPEAASNYQPAGFVPFVRNVLEAVYPNSVPRQEEIGTNICMALALGQRELGSFAIHPLADLKDVVVEAGDLKNKGGDIISRDKIEIQWVRYLEQPLDYSRRSLDYRPVPTLLMKNKTLDIPKDFNRQYVVIAKVPEDARPGKYQGVITIRPSNKPAVQMRLELTVYPFALETYADDDERIWIYYGGDFLRGYGGQILSEAEYWQWVDRDLAFMKEHLIAPTILSSYLKPSMDDFVRFMDLYRKYNFRGYALFEGYEFVSMIDNYGRKKGAGKLDYQPLINRFKEILVKSKEKSWPKILFYFTAEIHVGMPGYEETRRAIDLFKKEVPEAKLLVLPNKTEELDVMCRSKADVIGPNAVSLTEEGIAEVHQAGKKLWHYGWGRDRFRCGFSDWRCGCRGALREWYTYIMRAPFNPFDGSMQDAFNDSPPLYGPDGIVSTLGLEETTAGRTDFLYLATLDLWLERAIAQKDAKCEDAIKAAKALIDELKDRIKPEYAYYYERRKETGFKDNMFEASMEEVYKWKNNEYELYRSRIAENISALKKCLQK